MYSPKNMDRMPFALHVHIKLDGLAGGDYEYDPHLYHYASYDDFGFVNGVPLSLDSDNSIQMRIDGYKLRSLREIDANERIVFHIRSKSDHSGVDPLDTLRKGHTSITEYSGQAMLSLRQIVLSAIEGKPFAVLLDDPVVQGQYFNENVEARMNQDKVRELTPEIRRQLLELSVEESTKGRAVVMAEFANSTKQQLANYLRAIEARISAGNGEGGPLVYDTPRFERLWSEAMDLHMSAYEKTFGLPFHEDQAKYPLEKQAQLEDLLLVVDRQDFGTRLPVEFFKGHAPNKKQGVYAPNAEDAKLANAMVSSTLMQYNLSADSFMQAIGDLDKATKRTPRLTKACCVLATYATTPANTIEYSYDVSVPHKKFLHDLRPISAPSTTKPLPGPAPAAPASTSATTATPKSLPLDSNLKSGERFNHGTRSGESNSDDCEDESAVALSVENEIPSLALAAPKEAPLLQGLKKLHERYEFAAVGALATASYPDTEGKNAADLRSYDLPKRFDERDKKAKIAGHCHDLAFSYAIGARWASNGNIDPEVFLRGRTPTEIDYELPPLVLENTGPINPLILNAEEYGAEFQAEMHAIRELKKTIAEQCPNLIDSHRVTGSTFYEKKQDPERRVSMFYREILHLVIPSLYEKNPQLAQFQIIDLRTGKRGMDYGAFLRDKGTGVALVSHLVSIPRNRLESTIVPVMKVMSSLLPASVILRTERKNLPVIKTSETTLTSPSSSNQVSYSTIGPKPLLMPLSTALGRIGHLLGESTIHSLAAYKSDADGRTLNMVLDQHSLEMQQRQLSLHHLTLSAVGGGGSLVSNVNPSLPNTDVHEAERVIRENLDRPDRTVLMFHSQSWRLANASMKSVFSELATLKEKGLITGHVYWRDHPLAHCSDIIHLALFVPVVSVHK
jgi:hypothetical protein